MREYEFTVVLQPELNDEDRKALLERLDGWLRPEGSELPEPTVKHWGQRQLAYPIKDYTDGYYVYYEIMLEPSALVEIERNIKFNDDILRHLFVRKDE